MAYEYPLVVIVMRQSVQTRPTPAPAPAPVADEQDEDESLWAQRFTALRETVSESVYEMPRMSISLVLSMIAFIISIVMPKLLAYMLVPFLFSFWVPQIMQNYHTRSVGIPAGTVVGMTLTRFYLPLCTLHH